MQEALAAGRVLHIFPLQPYQPLSSTQNLLVVASQLEMLPPWDRHDNQCMDLQHGQGNVYMANCPDAPSQMLGSRVLWFACFASAISWPSLFVAILSMVAVALAVAKEVERCWCCKAITSRPSHRHDVWFVPFGCCGCGLIGFKVLMQCHIHLCLSLDCHMFFIVCKFFPNDWVLEMDVSQIRVWCHWFHQSLGYLWCWTCNEARDTISDRTHYMCLPSLNATKDFNRLLQLDTELQRLWYRRLLWITIIWPIRQRSCWWNMLDDLDEHPCADKPNWKTANIMWGIRTVDVERWWWSAT